MSDAAVATIVGGFITISTMVIGFLTLWLKIKYGSEKVDATAKEAADTAKEAATKVASIEEKVDANTDITKRIEKQTNGPLTEKFAHLETRISAKFALVDSHTLRITALEAKLEELKIILDALNKNLDSTRHEFRGHFQVITNSIQMLSIKPTAIQPAPGDKE